MSEVLKVKQVAELLNTTPQSVRNQISRGREGVSVPPSFRLGARRVWLREAVMAWLREKAGVSTLPRSKPGRPRSSSKCNAAARRSPAIQRMTPNTARHVGKAAMGKTRSDIREPQRRYERRVNADRANLNHARDSTASGFQILRRITSVS